MISLFPLWLNRDTPKLGASVPARHKCQHAKLFLFVYKLSHLNIFLIVFTLDVRLSKPAAFAGSHALLCGLIWGTAMKEHFYWQVRFTLESGISPVQMFWFTLGCATSRRREEGDSWISSLAWSISPSGFRRPFKHGHMNTHTQTLEILTETVNVLKRDL